MNGSGGSDLERRERSELLGRVSDVLAVGAEDALDLAQLEEHRAVVDVLDRMELELERGHDAEAAPEPVPDLEGRGSATNRSR